jgi:transposase
MHFELTTSDDPSTTQYARSSKALFLSVFYWARNCCWLLLQALLKIIGLEAEVAGLRDRVKMLEEENRRLYESANLDSDTSGIPPSKRRLGNVAHDEPDCPDAGRDIGGNKEPPIPVTGYINNKGGEKKKVGGQGGHAPAFMDISDVREGEPVAHYPDKCAACPHFDQCMEEGKFRKYQTSHSYDIEVIRIHRVHTLFEATDCPDGGGLVRGGFPNVIGSQFYDTNVQLHILAWHHLFHGSYDRIGLAAKELLGLPLSAGTANAIVQRVSSRILGSSFIDALRFFILLFETVMGVDETSARVGGRNAWVHTTVTANVTFLSAHWRRGFEGTVYAGVLQFFTRTLLSDCWATYFNEKFKSTNAVCNGHILRELVAAAYFRQQRWAIDMFDLLLEILSAKRDALERREGNLPREYLDDVRTRYRQIVAEGFNENIGVTKGKTFSLLDRLRNIEDAALAFAVDFDVDFTNNASEISIRDLKVALRVIGQFKTMAGLADYCIIQSFMDTCRKQGHNPYDMMKVVLSGGDIIAAVFGELKAAQIKQMIRLADAFATGDSNMVNAAMAETSLPLTDDLISAASYSRYKVCNEPPPEKKASPSSVPKDKMQAARESISNKNSGAVPASASGLQQGCSEILPILNSRNTRAGPVSA